MEAGNPSGFFKVPVLDPTAKQCSFETFYHYQPFDRDRVTSILRDQKIFCSDPRNVNDPWDCRPWFDYRPMLADPAKREQIITYFRSALPPNTFADPRRPIYEKVLRNNDDALKEAVEMSSRLLTEELAKRRIYCLTPIPDSTLMWSHYASNHRGLCLEFDKNNPLIEKARPVRYSETYPEWTPKVANPLDLVLAKSMDWSYEREFRIVASSVDGPLKLYGNFVLLPPGALTSIIVGCESKDYAEIVSIVQEHAPSVSVKRVVRVPNHYKLTIDCD
jgi:hypothetical protein